MLPFGVPYWKDRHPLFGSNDPKHVQKAVPRGLRTPSRVMYIFGFYCNLCPLVAGGCPRHALTGRDVHSDQEAAHFLNPRYLQTCRYDDTGVNLLQFINALTTSGWHISTLLTAEQIAKNALTSYFLILLWIKERRFSSSKGCQM